MTQAKTANQPEMIVLSRSIVSALIDMAADHVSDIESGIEDGTYAKDENRDLPNKQVTVESARREYYKQLQVSSASMTPVVSEQSQATSTNTTPVVTADGRFGSLFADVIGGLLGYCASIRDCKAALKIAVRDQYRDTGNSQEDYEHLRDCVEKAFEKLPDGAVLGYSKDMHIIQWAAEKREAYNSGQDLAEFGIRTLREEELELVHVSYKGWRKALAEAGVELKDLTKSIIENGLEMSITEARAKKLVSLGLIYDSTDGYFHIVDGHTFDDIENA